MFTPKDKIREMIYETMRNATSPIPVQSLIDIPRSRGIPIEVKRLQFVLEAIKEGYVEGFMTRDRETFWSVKAVQAYITDYINKYGRIKSIKFIKRYDLPKKVINVIEKEVENYKGFWSTDGRTFYVTKSAGRRMASFLKQKRKTTFFELKEKFKWADKDIIKLFNNIIKEGIFIGFMDSKTDIYNCHAIRKELEDRQSIASNFFYTYANETLMYEGELFTSKASTTFDNADETLIMELLQELKAQGYLKFVEAKSGDRVYSFKKVLDMAMRVIRSFKVIPLDFFAGHLNLEYEPAMQFLDLMVENFNLGVKEGDNFFPRLADDWISDTWVPEKISEDFAIPGGASEAIQFLFKICDEEGELIINQPEGVKALESLEITCQMDGKTYDFPDSFYECSNCKRVMCSNCYHTLPKHAPCPFCDNIAAFIIDYPRRCNTCGVNYVTVRGREGEVLDNCRYCNKSLDHGWTRLGVQQITPEEARVISYIENFEGDDGIPLIEIIDALGIPDLEAMILLEECINKKYITGRIDGINESFVRKKMEKELECAMSGRIIEPTEVYYKCAECGAVLSREAFSELEEVGVVMCPLCDYIDGFNEIQP